MVVGKRIEEKITAPPVPGSELDTLLMTELQHIYEKATPIVMELRNDPDYEEQGVYGNYTKDESPHRLTSGPLRGGRGLAIQVGFTPIEPVYLACEPHDLQWTLPLNLDHPF